jgi:hypothetical protein
VVVACYLIRQTRPSEFYPNGWGYLVQRAGQARCALWSQDRTYAWRVKTRRRHVVEEP